MKNNMIQINLEDVERQMKQFTSKLEIAEYFMCTEADLDKFIKRECECSYDELNKCMRAQGKAIIKDTQFILAKKDSKVAMRLGELYCDQKAENDIERIVIVDDLRDGKD